MSIEDAVKLFPESVHVLEKHGLGCIGCRAALFETIEQGAKVHGVNIDVLMTDLRRLVKEG